MCPPPSPCHIFHANRLLERSFTWKAPPPSPAWGRQKAGGGFEASLAYSAWYPAEMAKSSYYTVSLWHSEHLMGLLALVFPASQVKSKLAQSSYWPAVSRICCLELWAGILSARFSTNLECCFYLYEIYQSKKGGEFVKLLQVTEQGTRRAKNISAGPLRTPWCLPPIECKSLPRNRNAVFSPPLWQKAAGAFHKK